MCALKGIIQKQTIMYCKKCGKKIDDDALFCQFCGAPQDSNNGTKSENIDLVQRIKIIFNLESLSEKQKIWIGLYIVWFILNIIFVLVKYREWADNYFFPFAQQGGHSYFDLIYYDMSEFVVYVLLIPLLIYGIYRYKRKHHKSS